MTTESMFLGLSDELKVLVFEKVLENETKPHAPLSQMRLVCKDFKRLAEDSSFWRSLDLTDYMRSMTRSQLANILAMAPRVRSLYIPACRFRYTNTLTTAGLADLVTLDISGTAVGAEELAAIRTACPLISTLAIGGTSVDDAALAEFATNNTTLTSLDLRRVNSVTTEGIRCLATCPNLQSLNVAFVWKLAFENGLENVLEHCPHLHSLNVFGCRFFPELLAKLARQEKLISLDVTNNRMANSPEEFIALFEAPAATTLERIFLQGFDTMTDDVVAALADNCRSLTTVDLSYCTKLRPGVIVHLAERLGHSLRHLFIPNLHKVRDDALIQVVHACRSLRTLDISGCGDITNTAFLEVVESCPHLRNLAIDQCMKITWRVLAPLAMNCPNIENLSLAGLVNFKAEPLADFVANMPHLCALNLSANSWVTDEALSVIAPQLVNVEFLGLNRCRHLTRLGMGWLTYIDSLKYVCAQGCNRLDISETPAKDWNLISFYDDPNMETSYLQYKGWEVGVYGRLCLAVQDFE